MANGTACTVTLKDVPLAAGGSAGVFEGTGADLQRYVTAIQYADGPLNGGQIVSNVEYVATDWTATGSASHSLKLRFG